MNELGSTHHDHKANYINNTTNYPVISDSWNLEGVLRMSNNDSLVRNGIGLGSVLAVTIS